MRSIFVPKTERWNNIDVGLYPWHFFLWNISAFNVRSNSSGFGYLGDGSSIYFFAWEECETKGVQQCIWLCAHFEEVEGKNMLEFYFGAFEWLAEHWCWFQINYIEEQSKKALSDEKITVLYALVASHPRPRTVHREIRQK